MMESRVLEAASDFICGGGGDAGLHAVIRLGQMRVALHDNETTATLLCGGPLISEEMRGISVLTVFLTVLLSCLLVNLVRTERKRGIVKGGLEMAPGPIRIPIVGHLFLLKRFAHLKLRAMSRKFGSVFRVRIGPSKDVYFVSDPALVRDAWNREEFLGRPNLPLVDGVMQGQGIVSAVGDRWREQRRFVGSVLREMGVTRSRTKRERAQEYVESSAEILVERLRRKTTDGATVEIDNVTEMGQLVSCAVMRTLFSVILGLHFKFDDPTILDLIRISREGYELIGHLELINSFPWITRFRPWSSVMATFEAKKAETMTILTRLIDEQRRTMLADQPRGLVDSYLEHMDRGQGRYFDVEQLKHVLGDLYSGGLESTKATFLWATYYLAANPHVQTRIQDELDRVVGPNRQPTVADMDRMPYAHAAMLEVHRFATVLPTGVPHFTTRDTELGGFLVPAGSQVMPLNYNFNRDETLWKNAREFDPSNFLSEDGKRVVKPTHFMPFSAGRRVCLGEELAAMQMFVYLTSLLHNFSLESADAPLDSHVETDGFLRTPPTFRLRVVERANANNNDAYCPSAAA